MKQVRTYLAGLCATALLIAAPAQAKVVIGPLELQFEFMDNMIVAEQIEKMMSIVQYGRTLFSVLGSDLCNKLVNDITECTRTSLMKMGQDPLSVNKGSLIHAAQSCAGDLYVSDCISSGFDIMSDLAQKQQMLQNGLTATQSQAMSIWSSNANYMNFLTGEDVNVGANGMMNFGQNTASLFSQAVMPTHNMDLVRSCAKDAMSGSGWNPSITTLTASELAPTVPEEVKDTLVNSASKGQSLLGKLQGGYQDAKGTVGQVMGMADQARNMAGGAVDAAHHAKQDAKHAVWDAVAGAKDAARGAVVGAAHQAGQAVGGAAKDAADAAAGAAVGAAGAGIAAVEQKIYDTLFVREGGPVDLNDVRNNQNQAQMISLSFNIGGGQKAAALVGMSGEEIQQRQERIQQSNDFETLLKEVAALAAESLQKNYALTAMRAKLLEVRAMENIIDSGIHNLAAAVKQGG